MYPPLEVIHRLITGHVKKIMINSRRNRSFSVDNLYRKTQPRELSVDRGLRKSVMIIYKDGNNKSTSYPQTE